MTRQLDKTNNNCKTNQMITFYIQCLLVKCIRLLRANKITCNHVTVNITIINDIPQNCWMTT